MTAAELDEIEKREKAATAGPWTRKPLTSWNEDVKHENHNWNLIEGAETAEGYDYGMNGSDKTKPWGGQWRNEPRYIALPDAEFIAHARTDIPQLVAEVR